MENTLTRTRTGLRSTRKLVQLALLAAIIVVLANTPLGMIQLPIIKATTIHIPVILGAILLGPLAGGILGGVFGICSLISNTTAPTLLSFAFSPFMSTTGIPGMLKALWISIGCRILIGVVAGWLWRASTKIKMKDYVALPLVGFLGSMTNTILVMGSIYFLFAQQCAGERRCVDSGIWPCNGYGNRIRHPGSDCGRRFSRRDRQSAAESAAPCRELSDFDRSKAPAIYRQALCAFDGRG